MRIRIKYFGEVKKINKITKGNWIDLYSSEDIFVPLGENAMIPLGFALELPKGYEGHLAPRSSTFKTWGLIQTNSLGVIDDSFIGDNDMWCMPVYCLIAKDIRERDVVEKKESENELLTSSYMKKERGTWVKKGDKIAQFRIMEVMPTLEFEEVKTFNNKDRGGFGTTGKI